MPFARQLQRFVPLADRGCGSKLWRYCRYAAHDYDD